MNKTCPHCNETKEQSEFTPHKSCKSGYLSRCMECTKKKRKEDHKKWYQKNREKKLKQNTEYNKSEKYRNWLKQDYHQRPEVKLDKAMRRASRRCGEVNLTDRQKHWLHCIYARAQRLTALSGKRFEVDHIWPVNKGGLHVPWNLQIITMAENRKKGNKT